MMASRTLKTGSCPSLTKFSYLLGSAAPAYALEGPGQNPIRYQLVTDDPGVGLAAGTTQYRVGRRVGSSTTWILDWTSAGAGAPIGTDVTRFPIAVVDRSVVPARTGCVRYLAGLTGPCGLDSLTSAIAAWPTGCFCPAVCERCEC